MEEQKIVYGIGTRIKDAEDWKKFAGIFNAAMEGFEDANKLPEEFDGDVNELPGLVALDTMTLDDIKTDYENNPERIIQWNIVESMLKMVDADYPICLFRF